MKIKSIQCPKCGANELHENGMLHIRGFKVCDDNGEWWSQCLVCSGGYDKLNGTFNQEKSNDEKGWFR